MSFASCWFEPSSYRNRDIPLEIHIKILKTTKDIIGYLLTDHNNSNSNVLQHT